MEKYFKELPEYISLGMGVQSSTLAMMAAVGQLTPMPRAAIFSDTQHEPKAVYEWGKWLEVQLPFPIHRVSAGDLWKSATRVRTTKDGQRTYIATGIPVYIVNRDGLDLSTRNGIGKRQCTRDFKTVPITREVKRLLGLRRVSKKSPVLCKTWIGISADEAHRAKPSREPWIAKRFPLLELDMDRQDCLDWMKDHGFPQPPRSACTFCPFHDDNSWLALSPEELAAVPVMERELQEAYTKSTAMTGTPYFHDSRVPFDRVALKATPVHQRQHRMNFAPECEGLCGT